MKPLVKHAQKEFPKDLADRTIKFVQDRFYTNDSYRHRNLLEEVMGYLDKLGLIGPSRALNALSQGSIPMLHIQKLPNEEYFV
ncbi:hypothetical protein M1349_04405 [Patescibacteria group bacterium]|nr:hypothetical protein [Patescibacteria group bacterium]